MTRGLVGQRRSGRRRRLLRAAMAAAAILPTWILLGSLAAGKASAATSYVPIYGEGSSWSANAIDQWAADVQADGMQVNYTSNGSTQGREDFINGLTDFAASDIPFQTDPTDGSPPEHPQPNSYAYMPITAGGTAFMYNLQIDGQQVTNLRLSGENLAKIFTGQITNWDNPALAADNPDLDLPNLPIVAVVRSDGAGDSYELSQWMISQYPSVWNAFCSASGRAPACGPTSFWPTVTGMVAQSGDLGVAGYVSSSYADGAIGYVNYSYALQDHFPVAQMLNAAGYYTEPTPQNVAVSLLKAVVDTTDVNNPALYLTENLSGVYSDTDPRTYPLSSYSYLILPTTVQGQFNTQKGTTLAAFSYFAMCQGQQQSAPLGYSPMPINLVEASFQQITKIPGAVVQNINIQSCNNPTFTPNGTNLLADTAPYPPACAKQGPVQCSSGSGGDTAPTPPSSGGGGGGSQTTTTLSSGGGTTTGGPTASGGPSSGGGSSSSASPGAVQQGVTSAVGPSLAVSGSEDASCHASSTTDCHVAAQPLAGTDPEAVADVIAVRPGWSFTETVTAVIVVAFLAVLLVPGLVMARRRRRAQ